MNIFKLITARYLILIYGCILLFILFPIAIVWIAEAFANLSGCPEATEYSNTECTNGTILYALSQARWLLVFTIPVGFLVLGGIIFAHIVLYLLLKKRAVVLAYFLQRIRKKFFR